MNQVRGLYRKIAGDIDRTATETAAATWRGAVYGDHSVSDHVNRLVPLYVNASVAPHADGLVVSDALGVVIDDDGLAVLRGVHENVLLSLRIVEGELILAPGAKDVLRVVRPCNG